MVNGTSVIGTSINLGSNTSTNIILNAEVTLPNAPNDNYPGTINIYYKRNTSSSSVVAEGGYGGNLLFLGGTFSTRSFAITLSASQFDMTGGFLYAEYKTYSNLVYKSSNINVIKTTTPTGPSNPPGGAPINLGNYEIVPYGGIPILPKLPEPWSTSFASVSYSWMKSESTQSINDPNNGIYYPGTGIYRTTYLYIKQHEIHNDGTFADFYIAKFLVATQLLYYQNLINPFIFYQSVSVSNSIHSTQYIPYGTIPETIIGEPASVRQPNGTIIPATIFKWQKRIVRPLPSHYDYETYIQSYGWKDIPSATQQNYSPPATTEVTEYRRLIVEVSEYDNPGTAASNIVTIYPISIERTSGFNQICCNQRINAGQNAILIIGSTANTNYSYQWQKETIRNNMSSWDNIPNITKDCLPVPSGRRQPESIKYRRIVIDNNTFKYYLSNVVNIEWQQFSQSKNIPLIQIEDNAIALFPNPSNSVINIQSLENLASFNIKILDPTGRVIFRKEATIDFTANIIELNIDNFPTGIYNLVLEDDSSRIIKKFIKI